MGHLQIFRCLAITAMTVASSVCNFPPLSQLFNRPFLAIIYLLANYERIPRETEQGAMTTPLMAACLRGGGGCCMTMGSGLAAALLLVGACCGGGGWGCGWGAMAAASRGEMYVEVAKASDVGCWTTSRAAVSSWCLAFPFFRFSSSFIAL